MFGYKTISNFNNITKYNISNYFDRCDLFFKIGYKEISNFFNGKTNIIKSEYLNELFSLLKESKKLDELFKLNKNKFKTIDFWDLITFSEDLKSKLEVCNNLDKFLRSSRTKNNFNKGFSYEHQLSNQQTLENVSKDLLDDQNPDNDWINIALKNDLKEIEWDIDGGKNIIISKEKFIQNFVTSVIDNMIGEKIYGLDLQKKIEINNNDLKILGYKETVFQTVDILSKLKRGDIPEFSFLGVPSNIYVGSNLSGLSYSGIIRDLKKVFSTDNLFLNFKVKSLKYEEGSFFINFSVETKYNLLIEQSTLF